jgi:putative AlgH/UPF0301 family transcriptional regulator
VAAPVLDTKWPIALAQRNLLVDAFCVMLIVVIPVFVRAFLFAWRYRATNTKELYAPAWDVPRRWHAVINGPMYKKLDSLLPDDAAARKVTDTVYLGGPVLLPGLFAVTRKAPDDADTVVSLMPGLFAVLDAPTIDRIIETTPNDARYFVGLMLWNEDEVQDQVRSNAWEVRAADVDTVLRAKAPGLWNSLRGRMAGLKSNPFTRVT